MTGRSLRRSLQGFWSQRSGRERALIGLMLVVTALAAIGRGLLQPAWQLWQEAPARLQALQAQRLALHQLQAQARALQSQPRPEAGPGRLALAQSVAALKGHVQDEAKGLRVDWPAIQAADLSLWLHELQQKTGARITEAQLRALGPGLWSGHLVLEMRP